MSDPRIRATAVIVAAIASAFLLFAIYSLAGVNLTLADSAAQDDVGVTDVIVATLVAGVAAWAVNAFMARRGWRRWWPFVGSAALSLSMIGPGYQADGAGSVVALTGMHLLVGAILIGGLAWAASAGHAWSCDNADETQPSGRALSQDG